MLDVSHEKTIDQFWDRATLKAVLPVAPEEFFARSGPLPTTSNSQRAYVRQYLRRKAIIKQHSDSYGVYLQDCSRMGLGFLSPVQLLPCERIQIYMDNRHIYELEIRRCRRLADNCYECGTIFILAG